MIKLVSLEYIVIKQRDDSMSIKVTQSNTFGIM